MRRTKLTLSADSALVEAAKKLAAARGTSVSSMFSRFLHSLLAGTEKDLRSAPLTRKASGLVRLPTGRTDRELLEEALAAKHGPRR